MPRQLPPRIWPPRLRGLITVPTSATAVYSIEPHGAGLDVDFHLGEADDVGVGLAVVRVGVLGHAHQAEAGQRRRRRLGHGVDVAGQLVAVVARRRARWRASPPARSVRPRPARRAGRRARRRPRSPRAGRRDRRRRSRAACAIASCAAAWLARVIAWMVWLPSDVQVHGRCLLVSPHTTSTFSHGTPRISAGTRADVDHRVGAEVAGARLHHQPAVGPDASAGRRS